MTRRLSAPLCGLSCALLVGAGVALVPQPPLCEGLNRTELYRISQTYGLEQPRGVRFKKWLENLLSGDFGCSRTLP